MREAVFGVFGVVNGEAEDDDEEEEEEALSIGSSPSESAAPSFVGVTAALIAEGGIELLALELGAD